MIRQSVKVSGGVPQPSKTRRAFAFTSIIISELRAPFDHCPGRGHSGYRDQRALVMEMMYRYSEVNQGEIGGVMEGVDYTSVSRESKIAEGEN